MRFPLLILIFAACSGDATEPPSDGHQRMLDLLARIRDETPDQNPWLGDAPARKLREGLQQLPLNAEPPVRCDLLWRLSQMELRLGNEHAALELLKEAKRTFWDMPVSRRYVNDDHRTRFLFDLGVAFLRLGEIENCCARNSPESCIVPIRGDGVHKRPEGSRQAAEVFLEILKTYEKDSEPYLQSVWLLNIAHMTLGTHPDGVPEPFRIPATAFESDEPFPHFVNVAAKLGLDTFSLAGGVVADDLDNDADIDLLVTTWDTAGQPRFLANNGDGTFTDRTREAGLEGLLGGLNMVQADYDNDGDLDVYVLRGAWLGTSGRHPNSLLRNDGGTFRDVTFEAGLGAVHYPSQTAAWADYDNDGDVDLYVGNEQALGLEAPCQLFRNNGNGTFVDVAEAAGVENGAWTKAVSWGDYDADGYPDLYVSNFGSKNRLYHNNRNGAFTDVAEQSGVTGPGPSFPSWFWDYDNDGNLDLFVAAYSISISALAADYLGNDTSKVELAALYRGDGKGGFEDVARASGLTRPTAPMGSNFGDLDNDGYLDFYLGTGYPDYRELMPNVMYVNREGKRFADVTMAGGFGHLQKGHAVAFADFDGDGDLDVFEQMGGAYPGDGYYDALFENPGFGNHWIEVEVQGTRSNRSGIGARIRVVVGQRSFYRHVNSGGSFGANPLRQTIGLADADRVDRIEVYWPTTGVTQVLEGPAVDRLHKIVETSAGDA